jgi:3-oxoacyl-[acyl-carrier protein] reductase
VAAAIRDAGGQESHVACDVTKEADLRRAVSTVIEQYRRLDILAHNAGIYPIAPIEAMSEQLWDEVIDTNLKGTFFAAKAAFEVMKPQGYGRIIITSSITGPRTGIAGLAHYAASKAGINGFIKVAAIEFARFGVTVNAIEPGTIATEGVAALGEAYLQRAAQALPIKRLGTVEDCGYAVLFLPATKPLISLVRQLSSMVDSCFQNRRTHSRLRVPDTTALIPAASGSCG